MPQVLAAPSDHSAIRGDCTLSLQTRGSASLWAMQQAGPATSQAVTSGCSHHDVHNSRLMLDACDPAM